MPQLIADLPSGLTIKVLIYLATVDRGAVLGDLFIALTRVGRSQLMEAFQVVWMQDVPRRADDFLQNIQVAFMWRYQVAATSGDTRCANPSAL